MSTGLDVLRYPPTKQENYDELPIGFYFPWEKSMQSSLPAWFVECNGQLLDDADSPLDGEYIPNLNGIAKTKSATLDGTTTVVVDTTKDLYAGADVNGTSIPSGAKILSIDSDTEFTLDQSATDSGTETLTIGGNGPVFLAGDASSSGVWAADQFQKFSAEITTNIDGTGSSLINKTDGSTTSGTAYWTRPSASDPNRVYASKFLNDGTNGEPRTGTETYPKHRGIIYVMKIKYSNKVKLITGINVTGEEFGNFPESGANVKPTDRLAVFYPDGSIYNNVYAHRLRYSQPKTISTTPYTILEDDPIEILLNISSGTVNLPEATGSGREIKLIKIHATQNDITITPDGTDTIEGRSDDVLKAQYSYMILQDIVSGVWKQIEVRDVGTWTPYLIIGAADPSDATYNTQNGTYLRDDKLVTLTINLSLSNKGTDTGSLKLGGIPYYNTTGTTQYTGTIAKQYCNHGSGVVILQVTSTDNDMFFFRVVPDGSGTLGYIIDTEIANTFALHGTVTYRFI